MAFLNTFSVCLKFGCTVGLFYFCCVYCSMLTVKMKTQEDENKIPQSLKFSLSPVFSRPLALLSLRRVCGPVTHYSGARRGELWVEAPVARPGPVLPATVGCGFTLPQVHLALCLRGVWGIRRARSQTERTHTQHTCAQEHL